MRGWSGECGNIAAALEKSGKSRSKRLFQTVHTRAWCYAGHRTNIMLVSTRKALTGAIALFCTAIGLASPPPPVTADSAIILDAQSGKVLWGKDMETARFPASTTKIMTALLLIEHCRPDEVITAPPGVDKVEGASLHLVPGEQVTAGEMLYALLLRSANDACVAVADHISGSVPAFCQLMNQRAVQIGCTNTHFDNPNGLNDDKHTISAHDLALVARTAMQYQEFRAVVGIRKHVILRSINQQDRTLVSKNKYLSMDPTADGIKTGWTREAGQCYVGSATRNGYRIITVMLHGTDWKKTMRPCSTGLFKTTTARSWRRRAILSPILRWQVEPELGSQQRFPKTSIMFSKKSIPARPPWHSSRCRGSRRPF